MCTNAAVLCIFLVRSKGIRNGSVSFLSFLDVCFFNLLDSGLIGRTLLGSFCLWLILDSLCNALSVQWESECPWDPWICWWPHCALVHKCVVKGHQKLQKPIFEMDNPGNSAILRCLRVSSDTSICRSMTKLWLSHSYPEPQFPLEKYYVKNWQPYCLWQLTPWGLFGFSHPEQSPSSDSCSR